ncbi:acyl carrier protein phosphodiesterase [Pontibacter aydingkolensis]|uniref:ACP phosphodiesterase n=1 Tax=Pontibacter aydingkolensis TaxID=1911536 RepID=A0ABS7CZV4_9BACT|nr:ACP phosphodiesterase [Pontibacter aydingkolensis]MBW7469216.1 ACP phosphodiesterase [Pontibacter aydingkolensis]
MNFLAHAFLSGDNPELLLGNFIADTVKGKQAALYTSEVAKGIKLHRLIDTYTDTHEIVAETKARLRPQYRKFAPVIADMYYDHFLASRFEQYADEPLILYTEKVYNIVGASMHLLPERMKYIFEHMRQHNWLLGYAQLEGVGRALTGMSRRASFESGMETAVYELEQNYTLYADEFETFFPELVKYVEEVKQIL